MRTISRVLTAAGVIGVASSLTFPADPTLSPGARLAGDELVQTVAAELSGKQQAFFDQHGRYWQGLETHHTLREEPQPSNLRQRPSNEIQDWADMGLSVPSLTRFSLRTDVYQGPAGHGYTLTIRTREDGKIFEKVLNVGPETYRAQDWSYTPEQ